MTPSLGDLFKERTNNITLLRLIAALAVIYGHASAITVNSSPDLVARFFGYKFAGGVALDVFFVLSGFLVTASALSGKGVGYFVTSRVLRIFPALIVCSGLMAFVLGPIFTNSPNYWGWEVFRYFAVNASTWRTEYALPGVFTSLRDHAVNGSLWSLPVEVRMYAVILLLYVVGVLSKRVICNAVFFSALVLAYFNPSLFDPLLIQPNLTYLQVCGMFLIGAFFWLNRDFIPISPWHALVALSMAALVHGTDKFGVAYMIVLPYLVFSVSFISGLEWTNRIGDYSYGIYLYGWPIQQCMALAFPAKGSLFNAVTSCAVALVAGALSWYLVEKPAMKQKHAILAAAGRLLG